LVIWIRAGRAGGQGSGRRTNRWAPRWGAFAVIGGDAVRNPDADTFSCQLKCHDANGETYYVALARESVRITSYEDDAVLATVETWADGVAALN